MPGYDYFWNNAKGRNQDLIITFVPHHWLLTVSPCLVFQMVKNPQVWSLGQQDPLEKGMATYSSILKAIFLFPPNSVSVFFIQFLWAEKAKNLASKSIITIGAAIAEPMQNLGKSRLLNCSINLPMQKWGERGFNKTDFFSFFCLPEVKVIDLNDKYNTWPDYGWIVRGYLEKKAWNCCTSWEFLLQQVKLYVLLCLFL